MSDQASLPLSDPSSSPPAAQATPPAPAAPPAASAPQTIEAAKRPEWLPESFWDEKSGVKADDIQKHFARASENEAFRSAEESRRLTLPQSPDAYELKLPADFKPPEGVEFKFNVDDPLLARAREFAQKRGLDQEGFSEMLSLYAAVQVQDAATIQAAKQAEIQKLGVNGPARVDAVQRWLKSVGGEDAAALVGVLDYAPVAGTVKALEGLMKKFSSQGSGSFNHSHREQPEAGKIAGYEGMSFEQKRFAQDQQRTRRAG